MGLLAACAATGAALTVPRAITSTARLAAALLVPGRAMSRPMTAAIAFSRLLKAILDGLCS